MTYTIDYSNSIQLLVVYRNKWNIVRGRERERGKEGGREGGRERERGREREENTSTVRGWVVEGVRDKGNTPQDIVRLFTEDL